MIIETEYLLIGLGLLILYVIYYVISKDAQQSRQIRAIASAVEESNRRLFALEKKLGDRIDAVASRVESDDDADFQGQVEMQLKHVAASLSGSVTEMQNAVSTFQRDVDKRLMHLEEGMRQLTMPSAVTGMDDEKIIALYKQGVPLDAIAKELRVSKAEVEFVLKINKIR
ncbi:MAG: hypothetical protein R3302_03845 [Sulfurimonadaceae bacterium]|nr:hypothetical protein [Sulfurimonadaceae bacterium]